MSIAALQWAKQRTTGSAATKLVLLVLADYATPGPEDGALVPSTAHGRHFAYAGQQRIARECEMSVATVRRHEAELIRLGLIRKVKRFDRSGNRTSDWIVLAVDDHRPRPFEDAESGSHHSADPTTGQIDLRSPVSAGPPLNGERVTTSPEPPEESTKAGARVRTEDPALVLADELLTAQRGRIGVTRVALAGLLAPPLANGVTAENLRRAVVRILREGERLAPWTLQEYIAKTTSVSNLPFIQ